MIVRFILGLIAGWVIFRLYVWATRVLDKRTRIVVDARLRTILREQWQLVRDLGSNL